MFAQLQNIFQRLLECLKVLNNFSGVVENPQCLSSFKNYLGHPGTPVDLIIYLQAWKRLWIFYKFTKIIYDLLALQETLQNTYKPEKDSGSSTTSQNFQDLHAAQDILKISTSLANIIEFLKNHLRHPGTPVDFENIYKLGKYYGVSEKSFKTSSHSRSHYEINISL